MALYWLLNTVRANGRHRFAGEYVNDVAEDTSKLTAVGGKLYPQGLNAEVDTAGARAAQLRKKGRPYQELDQMMRAAYESAAVAQTPASLGGTIYVDAVAGNDNYPGSQALPIKTNAQLVARLNANPITASKTVVYVNLPPSTDPLRGAVKLQQAGDAQVVLNFQAPALTVKRAAQAVSAVTARLRTYGSATPWKVTGATLLDGTDVDLRARIVNGARAGARAFLMNNYGGNQFSTTEWCVQDPTASVIADTPVTPSAAGDTFVVEQAPGPLYVDAFEMSCVGTATFPNQPTIRFLDFDLALAPGGSKPATFVQHGVAVVYANCRFVDPLTTNGTFRFSSTLENGGMTYHWIMGSHFVVAASFDGPRSYGTAYMDACGFRTQIGTTNGGYLALLTGTVGQGAPARAYSTWGGKLDVEDCGFFDWTVSGTATGCLLVERRSEILVGLILFGAAGAWGLSAVAGTDAYNVFEGSQLIYEGVATSLLLAKGALATDFRGANSRTTAEAYNTATQAYTTSRNCTAALLATNVAGGGFADNAQFPENGARVYKSVNF